MRADFAAAGFRPRVARATSSRYANGQAIYSQGDAANAIFRVERGTVKRTVSSKRGKKVVLSVLRAGECFGECCLLESRARRTATATSMGESRIARVAKDVMVRRLRAEPELAQLFISHLLLRVARTEDDHADHLLNPSERRLARLLLQLSSSSNGSHGPDHSVPAARIDQGTLAQMVGTTRSRVSHFMTQFRKQGLIDYSGELRVHKALLTFLLRERALA